MSEMRRGDGNMPEGGPGGLPQGGPDPRSRYGKLPAASRMLQSRMRKNVVYWDSGDYYRDKSLHIEPETGKRHPGQAAVPQPHAPHRRSGLSNPSGLSAQPSGLTAQPAAGKIGDQEPEKSS